MSQIRRRPHPAALPRPRLDSSHCIDLRSHGIAEGHAAELRARLAAFAVDWDSAEMDVYDDYDTARAKLRVG